MDASHTTHQLEETVDAFQKQKLKDLQVGVVGPLLEVLGPASCMCVCACFPCVRVCTHVYVCVHMCVYAVCV